MLTFFLNASNVVYLVSYVVRDILWLRLLTIVGGLLGGAYFAFGPEPAWNAVGWVGLFTLINIVQVALLLLERRPVQLSDDARRLHETTFPSLAPRELASLLAIARWDDVAEGARLVARGEPADRLMVLLSGRARVVLPGRRNVVLGPGQLVGEMSFVTGESPTADVIALEPIRVVSWPREALAALLAEKPQLAVAMHAAIGADLASKLEAASAATVIERCASRLPRWPARRSTRYLASSSGTSPVARRDTARRPDARRPHISRQTPRLRPRSLDAVA